MPMVYFRKLELVLFYTLFAVVSADQPSKSPAPAVDCTQPLMTLTSCLSYVMNGSTTTEPARTCCDGLINVLATKSGPGCLCGSFDERAGQSGVQLNDSRASSLPTDCSITNYPSPATCNSLSKSDASPSSVVENPPSASDTAANTSSSVSSSSSMAGSVIKLLLRTAAAATAILFIY